VARRDLAIGLRDEGPQVSRVQRISVGKDATAHLVEKHVGKVTRIAQRFGGSLETVRRADNALQVLSASCNVSLHQPPRLRRRAQEMIEFDHVRWAAVDVGDNQPIGWSLADGGQQVHLSNGFRDWIFFFLEAEGSGHAATSGSGRGEVNPHALKHRLFGGHLHDGLVMAMAVDQRSALEFGKREGVVICALLEKFAEQEDLL